MRLAVLAGLIVSLYAANAGATPPVGTWFEYGFERKVGGGSGEYDGYSDALESEGRYEVVASSADIVRVRAAYSWSFSSNDGKRESGNEDRTIEFRASDRRYLGPQTDLDEWDDKEATSLAVWFWIPPEVQVGQTVPILDEPYLVVRRDATAWSGSNAYEAIEVRHEGTHQRNDEYGVFQFRYADSYYFDPTTGIVIGEDYRERDAFGDDHAMCGARESPLEARAERRRRDRRPHRGRAFGN